MTGATANIRDAFDNPEFKRILAEPNPFLSDEWEIRTGPVNTPLPAELPVKRGHPFFIADGEPLIPTHEWRITLGSWRLPDYIAPLRELTEALAEIEREDDPHDQRRRPGEVPRPKRTPPMWAVQPTKTRRDRKATRRVK